VELAAALRLVALYGWDDLVFTHLSLRVPGSEHHFLINPYELMFEEVTASSLVKIDTDGAPVSRSAYTVNAAGFTIHSAIHMRRPDVKAVLQLHTPSGQAVSAMLPHTETALIARHDVALHACRGIVSDRAECERLVTDLGGKNTMLLRNHGTLAVGETMAQGFLRMYSLERACEAQARMLATGCAKLHLQGTPHEMEPQCDSTALQALSECHAWPALLRKLDRIAPGYRA